MYNKKVHLEINFAPQSTGVHFLFNFMTLSELDSKLTYIEGLNQVAHPLESDILGAEQNSIEATQPFVESRVFNHIPEATYWLGIVATPNVIESPVYTNLYTAARQLRYEVYNKKGYLDTSSKQLDGGETDSDDQRSIHFIVLENSKDTENTERVVGTSRLIIKTDEEELPVEKYFEVRAPEGSVEASRFISQHENPQVQHYIAMAEIKALVDQALQLRSPFVYAVVEKKLMQYFKVQGIPFEVLPESNGGVIIEHYGHTVNYAIRFNPVEVAGGVLGRRRKKIVDFDAVKSMFQNQFNGEIVTNTAVGYYDERFERV